MQIALIGNKGHIHGLQSKIQNSRIGVGPESEYVYFENHLLPLELAEGKEYANTSIGLQSVFRIPEVQKRINEELGIEKGIVKSAIYAITNGTDFSDWIEVDFSFKMFSGSIGPDVFFTQGCAIKADVNPLDAIHNFNVLKNTIDKLHYRGELVVFINENYTINSIVFGHSFGFFALFSELSVGPTQNILNFVFGKNKTLRLKDDVAIGTLVWQLPFPWPLQQALPPISLPHQSEKHSWRIQQDNHELIFLTSRGDSSYKKAFGWMGYMLKHINQSNPQVCYRNDYGRPKRSFLLGQDKFTAFRHQDPPSRKKVSQSESRASQTPAQSESSPLPSKKKEYPSTPLSSSGQSSFGEELSKAQADAALDKVS